MLTDSHVHINHAKFRDDRNEVIARARAVGVDRMLIPAIDVASVEMALGMAQEHDGLFVMAGIHPSHVKDASDADWARIEALATEPGIVAIGETGLDYYWDTSFNEKQHEFLRRHIRLAVSLDLPLVFHNRDASEDLVRIVREEQAAASDSSRIRGVFHCFGGPEWLSDAVLELGFHVGIGGTFTFKNGGVPDAVRRIPMDRIMLETDAPFLAPHPHRGKRNEPAHVRLVAEALAMDRALSVEEVARITTENVDRVFGLQGHGR
jgi:TatD DNase family protein